MKRLNNKGFSLVELLAVVTILGIIAVISIAAYTKYMDSTRVKSCNILAQSAADAAANYYMEHSASTSSVSLATLVNENYLENRKNPYNKNGNCTGKVLITRDTSGKINSNSYEVILCCSTHYFTYQFPGGTKTTNSSCQAS